MTPYFIRNKFINNWISHGSYLYGTNDDFLETTCGNQVKCFLIVTKNDIFSLEWRHYGPKGDIWTKGNIHILVYYPIIS